MLISGFSRVFTIGFLLLGVLGSGLVSAAESCERAFQDSEGLNPDLEDTPDELDIPDSVWGNDPWPTADEMPLDGVYRLEEIELEKGYDITVKEGGRAIIFVNGDLEIDQTETLWNVDGTPDQLIVIVRGEVETGNQFTFNGILYAEDDIEFGNNFVGSGMISSSEEIELGKGKTDISGLDGKWADGLFIPDVCGFDGGCVASFPDGISSYNGGTIDFGYNAKLVNAADGVLAAGSISKNGGSTEATCDTDDCQASNEDVEPLSLPPFPAINPPPDSDVYVGYQDEQTVGGSGNRFGRIDTNSEAILNFSGINSTYYVKELNLGYRVELNLPAGDYYINRLSVNSQVRVNIIGEGTARLFINESVQLGSPSFFNSPGVDQQGDASKLMLISYSDVSFNSQATLSGAVYALGDINLGSPAYLYGAATASRISLNTDARIYYDVEGMSNMDYGDTCGGGGQKTVDHYRIYHPSQALTCTPADEIRVQACANSDCTELFDEAVTIELSPESGWSNNPLSFVGESNKLKLRSSQTDDPVQLGIAGASEIPTGTPQWRCYADGSSTQSNCQIQFSESGFFVDVDDHISGEEVSATVIAVKEGENDPNQCVPAFTGQKNVELSTIYQNPGPGTASGDHLIERMDSGDELDGSSQSLDFDSSGTAIFPIRYEDVGSVVLGARYEGSGEDAGLVMTGQDDFVARPHRFEVIIDGNSEGQDFSDGDYFKLAGEDFDIEVRSLNALGGITPNFGQEDNPENVELNVVEAPSAPLPNLPPLQGTLGSFGGSCENPEGGKACGTFSWPEVGAFAIEPTLLDPPYLTSEPVASDSLEYVGRFVPDHFILELVDANPGAVDMACNGVAGFTYSGQETEWAEIPRIQIIPRNIADDPTQNYLHEPFMRLSEDQVARKLPEQDDDQLLRDGATPYPVNVDIAPGTIEEREDGEPIIYRYGNFDTDTITYEKDDAAVRVEPFTPSLTFEITGLRDDDGREDNLDEAFPINPDVSGKIRYGRLTAENVYGPEDVEFLEMPFSVEYWDGERFILNEDDSCTSWTTDDIENPEAYHTMKDDSGTFSAGTGGPLELSPKGEQGTDTLRWEEIGNWLRDDLDGDGSLNYPSATATFGVYRGNDRIIYWREVQ